MKIKYTVLDTDICQEAKISNDGREYYFLSDGNHNFLVAVWNMNTVLATAHDDKHRAEMRRHFLRMVFDLCVDGDSGGSLEASFYGIAEKVLFN